MSNTKTENVTYVMYGLLLLVVVLMTSLCIIYDTEQNEEKHPATVQDADTVNDDVAVSEPEVVKTSKAEGNANEVGYTFKKGLGVKVSQNQK